jgi:hypothetical protein
LRLLEFLRFTRLTKIPGKQANLRLAGRLLNRAKGEYTRTYGASPPTLLHFPLLFEEAKLSYARGDRVVAIAQLWMSTKQLVQRHQEEEAARRGSGVDLSSSKDAERGYKKEAVRRRAELMTSEEEEMGRTTTKRGKNIFVKMFLKLANWLDPDLREKVDMDSLRSKIFVSDLSTCSLFSPFLVFPSLLPAPSLNFFLFLASKDSANPELIQNRCYTKQPYGAVPPPNYLPPTELVHLVVQILGLVLQVQFFFLRDPVCSLPADYLFFPGKGTKPSSSATPEKNSSPARNKRASEIFWSECFLPIPSPPKDEAKSRRR